jgi:hypothetical protein
MYALVTKREGGEPLESPTRTSVNSRRICKI